MLPNLDRIPSTGDRRAEQILIDAPRAADANYLASIGVEGAIDLARYGIRRTTVALRRSSVEILTEALWATALAAAARPTDDRDLTVGLALPHVVARELEVDPVALFAAIADRLPDSPMARLLTEFGSRQDIDLASFGWKRVETPDGPDFVPN